MEELGELPQIGGAGSKCIVGGALRIRGLLERSRQPNPPCSAATASSLQLSRLVGASTWATPSPSPEERLLSPFQPSFRFQPELQEVWATPTVNRAKRCFSPGALTVLTHFVTLEVHEGVPIFFRVFGRRRSLPTPVSVNPLPDLGKGELGKCFSERRGEGTAFSPRSCFLGSAPETPLSPWGGRHRVSLFCILTSVHPDPTSGFAPHGRNQRKQPDPFLPVPEHTGGARSQFGGLKGICEF